MNNEAQQEKELDGKVIPIVAAAKTLTIRNNETYSRAGDLLLAIKSARGEVAEAFDDLISSAHKHHRELIAKKSKYDLPLIQAEGYLKSSMSEYLEEQERIRREEEARLQVIANQQEEDRKLREAASLEAAGLIAEAEEVLNEPIHAPVLLPPMTPKLQGISSRETWSAEVVNLMALVQAVAAGSVPITAIQANATFLNQQARSLRGLLNYPGVRAVSAKSIAARS